MLKCVNSLNDGSHCKCSECQLSSRNLTYSQIQKFGRKGPQAILDKTSGHCWYCGVKLTSNKHHNNKKISKEIQSKQFTIDHFIPIAKGGGNSFDNKVPACRGCNNKRGSNTIEFLRMTLLFNRENWPRFKQIHYSFLLEKGFDLNSFGTYVFYFEEKNLWTK